MAARRTKEVGVKVDIIDNVLVDEALTVELVVADTVEVDGAAIEQPRDASDGPSDLAQARERERPSSSEHQPTGERPS